MNWKEDYAKEAAQDGRHAARSGDGKNPHAPGSMESLAWEQGWSSAQSEVEEQSMTQIDDLIEKLEAVTEGSRELDKEINYVLSPDRTKIWLGPGYWYDDTMPPGQGHKYKRYTTSLDAAMTLIPEGWILASLYEAVDPKDRPWCGAVLQRDEPYFVLKALGAKTLILAICIAALKARKETQS